MIIIQLLILIIMTKLGQVRLMETSDGSLSDKIDK